MVAYAGHIYWLLGPVSAIIGMKRGAARLRVEQMEVTPAEA